METLMSVHLIIPGSNLNVVTLSGYVNVKQDIQGDMELVLESNRCTFDMKTCEKFPSPTIRELCRKFNTKNAFYSSFFDNIKPTVKCPLKAGNYTINKTKLDLSPIYALPLDGYVWISKIKVLAKDKNNKKRIEMCMNTETKIIRTNVKRT